MGTWGVGNFDDDDARNFLDSLIRQLKESIEASLIPDNLKQPSFLEKYGDSKVVPAIDIICTLCEHYDNPPSLELATVENWREIYLQVYDDMVGSYGTELEYEKERRKAVADTFERLEEIVKKWS